VDQDTHLLEEQRSGDELPHLHPAGSGTAVGVTLKPEDLRLLLLTDREQVESMLMKYNALDLPRDNVFIFMDQLTRRRDTWFVEAGESGLFYFTNIVPRVDAEFHMLFWDKKLGGDRRESAKLVLHAAQKNFSLRRISSMVVESNGPLRKTLQKIGFVTEGIIRQSKVVNGEYQDAHLFGLLAEEMTWPVLKTSLV